jgi:hypothetical protein
MAPEEVGCDSWTGPKATQIGDPEAMDDFGNDDPGLRKNCHPVEELLIG